MRTYSQIRLYNPGLQGLGDISDIVAQVATFTTSDILNAFNTLNQAFHSEQQELMEMQRWAITAGNMQSLTPDGQQMYITAMQDKTDVVNGLQDDVSKYSSVLQSLGLNAQATGLTGMSDVAMRYRPRRLGFIPVIVGVVLSILIIVIGAGVWEYYQSKSADANARAAQARQMTQVQSNVPALVNAGWTPQQIQDYVNKSKPPQPSLVSEIPWTSLGIIAGVVLVAKSIFG